MLNPDTWLRQQVWQLLWQGPGAVSAYWSIPLPLVCTALSLSGPPELARTSLCILSVNVLLGVLLILVDEIGSCRNHDLGLLRVSAAKSRDRIAKLGIRSKQVDRFVNALWLNAELKCTFKNTRLESVELMVLALDLLSRIASRYGRYGRAGSVKRRALACALRHRLANRTCFLTSISSQHRLVRAIKRKRCGSRSRYTMWKLRDAIFVRCFSPFRISR
jgi:hypothetical protein